MERPLHHKSPFKLCRCCGTKAYGRQRVCRRCGVPAIWDLPSPEALAQHIADLERRRAFIEELMAGEDT